MISKFFIPHSSFFIPHSSFFIPHSSFFILHSSFFILHSSFFIPHSSFFILHSSFFIPHSSFLILHSSFFIPHSSFFIHHSSFIILHSSFFIFWGESEGASSLSSPPHNRQRKVFIFADIRRSYQATLKSLPLCPPVSTFFSREITSGTRRHHRLRSLSVSLSRGWRETTAPGKHQY